MTIVGVAAPGFSGVELEFVPQIFVPMMMKAQMTPLWDALKDRRSRFVNAFGRLKPGITREQAKASLAPFFKGILEMEVKEAAFRNASVEARERSCRTSSTCCRAARAGPTCAGSSRRRSSCSWP